MVRNTSIEVYRRIEEEGLLSKRRFQVYSVLFKHGPLTGTQLSKIVRANFGDWSMSETIRNRLTELRDQGVVDELGKVECPVNGNEVILWDVNSNLPKELPKNMDLTTKQAAKIMFDFLTELSKSHKEIIEEYNIAELRKLYLFCKKRM